MAIVNCKRCGRIFNRIRRDICANCIAEEDSAFAAVRAYLKDHPNATMADVVEATDVELELIVSMIRDGRLMLHDNPNMSYECQRCGGPTQSGRFCARCTEELAHTLAKATSEIKKQIKDSGDEGPKYYSKK